MNMINIMSAIHIRRHSNEVNKQLHFKIRFMYFVCIDGVRRDVRYDARRVRVINCSIFMLPDNICCSNNFYVNKPI